MIRAIIDVGNDDTVGIIWDKPDGDLTLSESATLEKSIEIKELTSSQ